MTTITATATATTTSIDPSTQNQHQKHQSSLPSSSSRVFTMPAKTIPLQPAAAHVFGSSGPKTMNSSPHSRHHHHHQQQHRTPSFNKPGTASSTSSNPFLPQHTTSSPNRTKTKTMPQTSNASDQQNDDGTQRQQQEQQQPKDDRPPPPIDTSSLYTILRVPHDASLDDIKRAYRKLVVLHHPDKGGDHATFQQIQTAYEVLRDESTREHYNRFGTIPSSHQANSNPTQWFPSTARNFQNLHVFSKQRPTPRRTHRANRPSRGPTTPAATGTGVTSKGLDIHVALPVTLSDLYHGNPCLPLGSINRQEVKDNQIQLCMACQGRGCTIQLRQIAMGMVQQVQTTCASCNGKKLIFTLVSTTPDLQVCLHAGMAHGDQITLQGQGHVAPRMIQSQQQQQQQCVDIQRGNVIVTLQQEPHSHFQRRRCDLSMVKRISLKQALCGMHTFELNHVKGETLRVSPSHGDVISPTAIMTEQQREESHLSSVVPSCRVLRGWGMPIFDSTLPSAHPLKYGDLYIIFQVNFPKTLSPSVLSQLQMLLPDDEDNNDAASNGNINGSNKTLDSTSDDDDDAMEENSNGSNNDEESDKTNLNTTKDDKSSVVPVRLEAGHVQQFGTLKPTNDQANNNNASSTFPHVQSHVYHEDSNNPHEVQCQQS